jgi:YD repeat-containing protein
VTSYAYDTLNRLTGLTDFSHANSTFGYDALSRRTSLARPAVRSGYLPRDNLRHFEPAGHGIQQRELGRGLVGAEL